MKISEAFGINGPVTRFFNLLFEFLYVSVLWMIFGGFALLFAAQWIPAGDNTFLRIIVYVMIALSFLLTGPGTTAAYATLSKISRNEESYTFHDFWKSYKQNFGQGIALMAILGLFGGLMLYLMWFETANISLMGTWVIVSVIAQIFFLIEDVIMLIFALALLARFEMKTKQILKFSFLMSNRHIWTSLLCAAIAAGCIYVCGWLNQALILFLPGAGIYLACLLIERVFRKYMPKEDYLSAEELDQGFQLKKTQDDEDEVKKREAEMDAERQAIIDRYTGKNKKTTEPKQTTPSSPSVSPTQEASPKAEAAPEATAQPEQEEGKTKSPSKDENAENYDENEAPQSK